MGLDTVEIILRCEETFGIDLPDAECAAIRAVGDFYRAILARLELSYIPMQRIEAEALGSSRFQKVRLSVQPWSAPDVWRTLTDIIQDQLQLDPEEIKESARFFDDLRCD